MKPIKWEEKEEGSAQDRPPRTWKGPGVPIATAHLVVAPRLDSSGVKLLPPVPLALPFNQLPTLDLPPHAQDKSVTAPQAQETKEPKHHVFSSSGFSPQQYLPSQ